MPPYRSLKAKSRKAKGRRAKGSPAVKLGDFILGETPYPNPVPLKLSRAAGLKLYGPGRRFTTAHPFKIADVRSKKAGLPKARVRKILRAGLFWKIGGATRRMSKAARIPYSYYDPGSKKYVKAALVIGWEGAGGGS